MQPLQALDDGAQVHGVAHPVAIARSHRLRDGDGKGLAPLAVCDHAHHLQGGLQVLRGRRLLGTPACRIRA